MADVRDRVRGRVREQVGGAGKGCIYIYTSAFLHVIACSERSTNENGFTLNHLNDGYLIDLHSFSICHSDKQSK